MSPFVEWNRLLLAHFFSPAAKGEETWLQTSKAELDSIGLRLGGSEGLVVAVQEGPPWLNDYQNVAEAADRLARQRMAKVRSSDYIEPGDIDEAYSGCAAPTYLPYLALWVMASSESEKGFYAAVERMSGRPFPTTSNQIRSQMLSTWNDLEAWTRTCNGEFGYFALRVLGDHRFVGIPRSQCLISRKDKRGLPHLFSECRLRPRQELNDRTYVQVASLAANAYYLSRGLQVAFNAAEYADPLKRMLIAALQSWDGKVPRPRTGMAEQAVQNGHGCEDALDEVRLILRPSQSTVSDWDIHWRIPSLVCAGKFHLAAGGAVWEAALEEVGTHAVSNSASYPDEARRILACAAESDIEFTASFTEVGDDNGLGIRKLVLPRRLIRTLAWDVPDPRYGRELIEGEVPLAGPCYLLFAGNRKGFLARLLGACQADWELVDATGLPDGWQLGCILYSDKLSTEQRQHISEGHLAYHEKARIRLVGGRPILRGGGRTYAFYDLPILEIEAQPGCALVSEGLEFSELNFSEAISIQPFGTRRFQIKITDDRRAFFHIRVVVSGETLVTATLKVSVAGGKAVAKGRNFGLGPLGRPVGNGNRLIGVLQSEVGQVISGSPPTAPFAAAQGCWKPLSSMEDLQEITKSLPAKFLDSLAQLGSIAYGSARDQLHRLAHQARLDVSPALVLLELRSRGHLEIETDDQGHLVRIHAVPPTLYSLPLQRGEHPVRAVCGTLRLQNWQDLGEYPGSEVLQEGCPSRLSSLYLVPSSEKEHEAFVEMAGFKDACMPASTIAEWAGGITDARSELGAWGWETLSAEIRHLQRFNPGCAEFKYQNGSSLMVDPLVGAELYRFEDPTVQGLQVYVLGTLKSNGLRQFGFLQDSRWGIWLAMSSFAEFVKREYGIGDAVPWPIHYAATEGILWLPARLRPPFVIERALVMCSASAPTPVTLGNDNVNWIRHFNGVYGEMTTGVWLAYRWVPESIAMRVAALLGATLSFT